MKKIIEVFGVSLLVALLTALPVSTETINFVTTLSAPVGVFSRVDVLDASSRLDAQHDSLHPTINFCNINGNHGAITVQGTNANDVEVGVLRMQSNSTLNSNFLLSAVNRWVFTNPINIKNTAKISVSKALLSILTHVKTNDVSAPVWLMVGSTETTGILDIHNKTVGDSSGEVRTGGLRAHTIQLGSPYSNPWFPGVKSGGTYTTSEIKTATWKNFSEMSGKATVSGTAPTHVLRWGAN